MQTICSTYCFSELCKWPNVLLKVPQQRRRFPTFSYCCLFVVLFSVSCPAGAQLLADGSVNPLRRLASGESRRGAAYITPKRTLSDSDYRTVLSGDSSGMAMAWPDGTYAYLDYETSLWYPVHRSESPNDLWLNGHISLKVSSLRDSALRIHCPAYELIVDPGSELDLDAERWTPPSPKAAYVISQLSCVKGSFQMVNSNIDQKFAAPRRITVLGNDSVCVNTSVDWPMTSLWRTDTANWHFNLISIQTALASIGRWYHVQITYDPIEENGKVIFATLPKSLCLREMLELVRESWLKVNWTYTQHKDHIHFTHKL